MEAQDDADTVTARHSPLLSGLVAEADEAKSTAASTPNGIRSSPPALKDDAAMDLDAPNGSPEDHGVKSDSEAETIVLPGKDGHSPSKIRKSIKHEDKSEDEGMANAPDVGSADGGVDATKDFGLRETEEPSESAVATSTLGKRKRLKHGSNKDDPAHLGNSSGLSSVPTSPFATTRSSLSKRAASDSDISRSPSPAVRDKAKSVDRVFPRRIQYGSGSGDEGEVRRFGRQRSGTDHKQSRDVRGSLKQHLESHSRKHTRSISPPARTHRRSISSQLPPKSTQGLSHKKKRVPAPLQSTEYLSDDSSASGSSHPRSSRLRNLAAPTTGESTISPAKMAPHKKHVNSSGQTLVARACASGKLDIAKQRLEERPDDLNEGDHAMNTPLHFASIDGHTDIVKLLLDAGCIVDPINMARDTPLHDAIDNGHLEVVKLLLDAGANPRKANGKGEDPYDLVDDLHGKSMAAEMKDAIVAAKQRSSDVRRSSEDDQMHDNVDSRLSHPKGSPRHTPPVQIYESQILGHTSRRNATTRSIKTSDRILYQPLNLTELRKAAGSNDVDSVVRVLDVHNNNLDDPKSLIIAVKAGHHDVINLLFGVGGFNPDPEPLDNMPPESATPILAAIGRDNLQVIDLFLNQPNFDPTRLVNGETYYEIAQRRAGTVWKDEATLLRNAFEKYKESHKSSPGKPRSPGLRRDGRDADRDARRMPRKDEQQTFRSHKRTTSSPKAKESEARKSLQVSSSSTIHGKDGQSHAKRGPGRPRKEESAASAVISDRETTPLGPPKQKSQARRSESDVTVASLENETTTKPRRKLVSGKEFRGERELEKQRRASIASNASSASVKDRREGESKADKLARRASPSVPRISKSSNHSEQEFAAEKSHADKDRARSIKRDDSKDRLTAIRGESPVKRPRKSATPPRSGMQEVTIGYDASGGPQKRRKLEGDSKAGSKAETASSSPPDQPPAAAKTSLSHERSTAKSNSDTKDKDSRSTIKRFESPDRPRHTNDEPSKKQDEKPATSSSVAKGPNSVGEGFGKDIVMEDVEILALKAAEERKAQSRREKEELEAKHKAEAEERLELERIEQAKQARIAREQVAREEESRRQQEEAERKERQRQEDAEAHAREVERQRIVYLEQEKQKREEQERRRAQVQEQQRAERIRLEKEKRLERLAKLPLLLRWFDLAKDPKTAEIASLFRYIEGFRYDTIKPEATGQPNGREEWMLNTHAALLLGEKDLQLSRYTAWERITLSRAAKQAIWKFENPIYSLAHQNLIALRKQFPDNGEPGYKIVETCKALFLDIDLFFVKVSEFMFIVPNFLHLRGLELVVKYRELEEVPVWPPQPGKWRRDPDIDPNQPFAPRPKYYVDGNFVRQGEILCTKTSTTSFGERRVPRRGLVQVFPGEADYEKLAREQGLLQLLPGYQATHQQPNGTTHGQVNGVTPPSSDKSKSINGGSPHQGPLSEPRPPQSLPNVTHVETSTDTVPDANSSGALE